jgi:hypothetical protein
MTTDTETIRRGLRNIRTRAATIDAVAEQGAALVGELLPLLQDRHEGVRWSTIRILSEVGDERAVGPLVALLEQGKNATDAANALESITGQELGAEPEPWRRWVMQDPGRRNAAAAGLLSDHDLVAAAARDLPVSVQGEGTAYTVTVSLDEGRTQQVWIDMSRKDPKGDAIVQLCTPCGEVDTSQYEAALKLNMSIPFGAIAIAELDGALCFAVVDTYLRVSVHPEDIAQSIMSLARYGDLVEKSLSDTDRY